MTWEYNAQRINEGIKARRVMRKACRKIAVEYSPVTLPESVIKRICNRRKLYNFLGALNNMRPAISRALTRLPNYLDNQLRGLSKMTRKLSHAFLTDKDTTAFLLRLCDFVIRLQLDDGFKGKNNNGRHTENRCSDLDTSRADWHNDDTIRL